MDAENRVLPSARTATGGGDVGAAHGPGSSDGSSRLIVHLAIETARRRGGAGTALITPILAAWAPTGYAQRGKKRRISSRHVEKEISPARARPTPVALNLTCGDAAPGGLPLQFPVPVKALPLPRAHSRVLRRRRGCEWFWIVASCDLLHGRVDAADRIHTFYGDIASAHRFRALV